MMLAAKVPVRRAAVGGETAFPVTRGSAKNNHSSFGCKHSDLGFLFSFLAGKKQFLPKVLAVKHRLENLSPCRGSQEEADSREIFKASSHEMVFTCPGTSAAHPQGSQSHPRHPRAASTWEMGTCRPHPHPRAPSSPSSAAGEAQDAPAPLLAIPPAGTGQDTEPIVKDVFKSSQGRPLSRRCPRHGSRLHRITNSGREGGEEAKDLLGSLVPGQKHFATSFCILLILFSPLTVIRT